VVEALLLFAPGPLALGDWSDTFFVGTTKSKFVGDAFFNILISIIGVFLDLAPEGGQNGFGFAT